MVVIVTESRPKSPEFRFRNYRNLPRCTMFFAKDVQRPPSRCKYWVLVGWISLVTSQSPHRRNSHVSHGKSKKSGRQNLQKEMTRLIKFGHWLRIDGYRSWQFSEMMVIGVFFFEPKISIGSGNSRWDKYKRLGASWKTVQCLVEGQNSSLGACKKGCRCSGTVPWGS